ncbi:hypothetical protein DY000_02059139 [Brassica cretica]|uniref:Uncharacterized protein n=1 Tax=Brassica cretica TaxID=69181 RepID=A0ABQ7APT2_BRACR|nr:hypothetical protein DY000_02059139 [Brassica cretica]
MCILLEWGSRFRWKLQSRGVEIRWRWLFLRTYGEGTVRRGGSESVFRVHGVAHFPLFGVLRLSIVGFFGSERFRSLFTVIKSAMVSIGLGGEPHNSFEALPSGIFFSPSDSFGCLDGSPESLAVFESASRGSSDPGTVDVAMEAIRLCAGPLMAEASTCSIWDAVQSVVWRYIQTSFGGVGKALLLQRRQGNSRHLRQRGEPHFSENHVDGRERLPISKDFEKQTSGMCRV